MREFRAWYVSLRPMRAYGDRPAKGTIAAALIVLDRLREGCDLRLDAHLAPGGAQIAGMSLPALRRILERFGERREFPSEGGRTNRGNNTPIANMLAALGRGGLETMEAQARGAAIDEMQRFLVTTLDAYYRLERIRFDFDARRPVRVLINDILLKARDRGQAGAVAQHLVGAKLAIRFPEKTIGNFPYSAADEQGGRSGDFQVGNTAFHVTVSPTCGHAERCSRNLRAGLAVFLIVPDSEVGRGRLRVEDEGLTGRVAVESLESFVGQNVSEIAEFSPDRLSHTLGDMLREYNRRVSSVETDGSLLIAVPGALGGEEDE